MQQINRKLSGGRTRYRTLEDRTSVEQAAACYECLEVSTIFLFAASVVIFFGGVWALSLDRTENVRIWYLEEQLYWNASILAITLSGVLLIWAGKEQLLAQGNLDLET